LTVIVGLLTLSIIASVIVSRVQERRKFKAE